MKYQFEYFPAICRAALELPPWKISGCGLLTGRGTSHASLMRKKSPRNVNRSWVHRPFRTWMNSSDWRYRSSCSSQGTPNAWYSPLNQPLKMLTA